MLDHMFSMIDDGDGLHLEPFEEGLSFFIAQFDAFSASPKNKARLPMATPRPLTEETYKEMWMLRYQQHLGQITFLELLSKYEEILGIPSPSESAQ